MLWNPHGYWAFRHDRNADRGFVSNPGRFIGCALTIGQRGAAWRRADNFIFGVGQCRLVSPRSLVAKARLHEPSESRTRVDVHSRHEWRDEVLVVGHECNPFPVAA
jgi:hypothetical protein